MLFRLFILLSLQFFFVSACSSASKRPQFAKKNIRVASQKLKVEIADSPEKISYGLMFKLKPLSQKEGMLFVFKDEKVRNFWMKNTFIPLSIGFFDRNKKLVHMTKMQPVRSEMEAPKTYSSNVPAMYALEVHSGWFAKNKIEIGASLKF